MENYINVPIGITSEDVESVNSKMSHSVVKTSRIRSSIYDRDGNLVRRFRSGQDPDEDPILSQIKTLL